MKGKNFGILLAGVWFILTGLIPLFKINIANLNPIMAIFAVIIGILLLIGK